MIEVDRLTKRFGPVTAVDGLSFTVRPGHVTGFLGPNGAGKTTTMRLILGLDAPTSGTAQVNQKRYAELVRPLHQVGALLDATALAGGRTAWAHVASIAQSNGIGRRRVTEMLRLTGLEAVAGRRVGSFSLGMKQRLGIAVALLGDPPVLMFDEPVNGLDTEGIAWIRQFFKALAADGRTVLVSSHLMSEMAQTADHLIVIGRGRLLADVPTATLIESSTRRDVEYAVLAVSVLGVLGFSTEYSTGLIRTTFAAMPRRRVVLAAKAAVLGTVTLVAGELVAFASFFLAQAILSGHHLGLSLSTPGVAGAVLAEGLLLFVVAMLGLALGAIVRHTAGGIAAVVGLIFLPAIAGLLPAPWGGRVGRFTLLEAAHQVTALHPAANLFSPALSLLVLLAWPAAALLIAALAITRRDA